MNALATTNPETQNEPLATRVTFHPFLAGMNRTHLTLLTDCAVARHFNTDQTILREREFATGFYLIETGKVALESEAGFGESIVIQTIGAGDLLGWSWMFPRMSGNLQHTRSSRPARCFFTRQFCGNTARRSTR